jgi:hypothetical protein
MECSHELALRCGIPSPSEAPDAHQRRPAIPLGRTASPPNSTLYPVEAGRREWRCCLHFTRILLAPSLYKNKTPQSSGRTHAPWHGGNTTMQLHSSTMLGA